LALLWWPFEEDELVEEEFRAEAVVEVVLLTSIWYPNNWPQLLRTRSLQQYETKMKKPWSGVMMENRSKKITCTTSSSMNTMINPNNHDNPMDAKMEKYTLISLDFSFLSEFGADFKVS